MARPGRPRMPKAPLPGTVDAFLDMLIAERGAALNTRHAYERDLADVCAFLKKQSKDINTATTIDLKSYLGELGGRENVKSKGGGKTAVRTIARRISALRQFYGFLVSEGAAENITDAAYRYARHEQGADVILFGTGNKAHVAANVASILRPPLPPSIVERIHRSFGHLTGVGLDRPGPVS